MRTTAATHIWLDERGVAWVDDTNVKVREIVLDKLAHDCTVEEMAVQFPHLGISQIYAALAYYHDHQAELDAQIEGDRAAVAELRASSSPTPGREKLRVQGHRP